MAKKKVKRDAGGVSRRKNDDSKGFAFLAAFLSIIGFVIALIAKKDDDYVMHYAKQSLVIFIADIIVWVVAIPLMWIPVIGSLIIFILYVVIVVLWVMSWIYALSGEKKEVPLIGKYARGLKF